MPQIRNMGQTHPTFAILVLLGEACSGTSGTSGARAQVVQVVGVVPVEGVVQVVKMTKMTPPKHKILLPTTMAKMTIQFALL